MRDMKTDGLIPCRKILLVQVQYVRGISGMREPTGRVAFRKRPTAGNSKINIQSYHN